MEGGVVDHGGGDFVLGEETDNEAGAEAVACEGV